MSRNGPLWWRFSLYGLVAVNVGLAMWLIIGFVSPGESQSSSPMSLSQATCAIPEGDVAAIPERFREAMRLQFSASEAVLIFFHPDSTAQADRFTRTLNSCHDRSSSMNRTAVLTFPDRGLAQQVPVSYRTTSGSVDGADPLRQAFSVQNEATIFYDIATGRVRSGEPYVFNPYVLCDQLNRME